MTEGDGDGDQIQYVLGKEIVEMCCNQNLGTVRAFVEEVANDTAKQPGAICEPFY